MKIPINKETSLFNFLQELYPQSPKTRIKKLLQSGTIICNGRPVTLYSYELKKGDVLEINSGKGNIINKSLPFKILYEDQYIMVIDKPTGISTSSTDNSPNVHKILTDTLKQQSKGKIRSHVVHRLDKEVSGALLFAKSEEIMNILKNRWKETKKLYFALVEGEPKEPEGTIKSFLVEDKNYKMHSTAYEKGKFSITHYRTIRRLNQYTLLEVNLETGRKNQIRVHLSDIECPIVGDRKYGASDEYIRKIRLHAWSLSFPHPVSNEVISVESPLPDYFLKVKDKNED